MFGSGSLSVLLPAHLIGLAELRSGWSLLGMKCLLLHIGHRDTELVVDIAVVQELSTSKVDE